MHHEQGVTDTELSLYALQGKYTNLLNKQTVAIHTGVVGNYTVHNASWGMHNLVLESCTDYITGLPVRYPHEAALPPVQRPTLAQLAILATVAAKDEDFLAKYNISMPDALGSRTLLEAVFAKYGYSQVSSNQATVSCQSLLVMWGTTVVLGATHSLICAVVIGAYGLLSASARRHCCITG